MSHRSLPRLVAALALVAPVLGLSLPAGHASALAAPRITVTNDRGGNQADVTYQTPLTIRATGFQSIKGGFGGVYLMFGWVRPGGGWQPSKGGVTGTDYKYIPDSESESNQGYLSFIAFPGSSTESEAQAVLNAAGTFQVSLTVPGPVFQSVDRDGEVSDVDCRTVTCGIITIGAHGVKNARNETFTPVPFTEVYAAESAAEEDDGSTSSPTQQETTRPSAQPGDGSDQPATPEPAGTTGSTSANRSPKTSPVARGKGVKATLVTDRLTARAGSPLAFTGTGFDPGEQVLAILDDGVVALGPMIAGRSGEVAGLLPLPVELRVGTHQLRLTGAASGGAPSERFPVAEATPTTAVTETDDERTTIWSTSRIFLAVAVGGFLLAAGVSLLRSHTRRRGRARLAPATGGVA